MNASPPKPSECPLGHAATPLIPGVFYCSECREVLTGPEMAWHPCPVVSDLALALLAERSQTLAHVSTHTLDSL